MRSWFVKQAVTDEVNRMVKISSHNIGAAQLNASTDQKNCKNRQCTLTKQAELS